MYDAVVAGAGVAGALIAAELTRAGLRIALVDAGDTTYFDPRSGRDRRDSLVATFFRAPVKTTNSAYPSVEWAPSPDEGALNAYYVQRGPAPFESTYQRIVGGTTYHWLGTALRYTPETFAERTLFGRGADWPLSYADLESWYARAETELGVAGDDDQDLGCPRSADHRYPMPPIVATYNDRVVMSAPPG